MSALPFPQYSIITRRIETVFAANLFIYYVKRLRIGFDSEAFGKIIVRRAQRELFLLGWLNNYLNRISARFMTNVK